MPYSEVLTDRIRQALAHLPKVVEKKMFGGTAFMVSSKMCLTARAERIMCRIDPGIHEEVLKKKDCRTVIMKGREYMGYVYVDKDNLKTKTDLNYWVKLALDYNKKLKLAVKRQKK